ncbi:hypothetical protein B0H34DRAFT_726787 [Crassisporium funariophilum]|nr:hypothetical protein B0H34DRAFT_726787 [Crassisporium funariophilum]
MAESLRVPIEIVEVIIDILAQDDEGFVGVKACSLACHDLVALCQKHLFASIKLNRSQSHTTYTLENLLSAAPHIANYMRKLDFCVELQDYRTPSFRRSVFLQILRLESLTIRHYSRDNGLLWTSNNLRHSLLHLLHLPTLTQLKLVSIVNFQLSDLVPCVNLKELHLDNVTTVKSRNSLPFDSSKTPIKLCKYTAELGTSITNRDMCTMNRADGLPLIDFSCVRKVSVTFEDLTSIASFKELLRRCVQLTHAYFLVPFPSLTLDGLAEMVAPSMNTLKNICLDLCIDDLFGDDPFSGLCAELDQMNGRNIIETIQIGIFLDTNANCRRGDEWGRLDSALTRSGWSALRRVSVSIHIFKDERMNDDLARALRELPGTQFKRLSSWNSVDFEFGVNSGRMYNT